MRRPLLALAILLVLVPLTALAAEEDGGIDVIDVSGPLDASALEFMRSSIEMAAEHGQELAVLQINSPAVLDAGIRSALIEIVENPPLPVAIWVGPAPAVAYGGAGRSLVCCRASAHSRPAPTSRDPFAHYRRRERT